MRNDPALRLEVETARSWGVSHSVLLGRVRGPRDPLFTEQDMLLATALQEIEAGACSGCGHDREESMAPEGEFAYDTEILRCHACAARSKALEKYAESGGNTEGVIVTATDRRK